MPTIRSPGSILSRESLLILKSRDGAHARTTPARVTAAFFPSPGLARRVLRSVGRADRHDGGGASDVAGKASICPRSD